MKIDCAAHPTELPNIILQFLKLVPLKTWQDRVSALRKMAETSPLSALYVEETHGLELTLVDVMHHARTYNRLLPAKTSEKHYRLYAFIVALMRIHQNLDAESKQRLVGMIKDGLKRDEGLTSLQHEMSTFVALQSRGMDVDCIDLNGLDRYDYLTIKNDVKLAVECKCVGGDLGRKITRKDARSIYRKVLPILSAQLEDRSSKIGLAVTLEIDGRSTSNNEVTDCYAASIQNALEVNASSHAECGYSVTCSTFEYEGSIFDTDLPANIHSQDFAQFCFDIFGSDNPHVFIIGNKSSGSILFCIRSKLPDQLPEKLLRLCKDTARNQLPECDAGIIDIQLYDLQESELEQLINERNMQGRTNQLVGIASIFFESESRKNIYGISFKSHASVYMNEPIEGKPTHLQTYASGHLYFFRNPNHRYFDNSEYQIYIQP